MQHQKRLRSSTPSQRDMTTQELKRPRTDFGQRTPENQLTPQVATGSPAQESFLAASYRTVVNMIPARPNVSVNRKRWGELKRQTRLLDEELRRQDSELQGTARECQRLQGVVELRNRELQAQKDLLQRSQQKLDNADHFMSRQNQEIDRLKKLAKEEEASSKKLRQEVSEMHAKQNQREQNLRKLQESAASRLESAAWTQDDDEVIRRKFSMLDKTVQTWGKRYSECSLDFLKCASPAEIAGFKSTWSTFAQLEGVDDNVMHPNLSTRAPAMLLTGWLNYYIYNKIFEHPWFFVDYRNRHSNDANSSPQNKNDHNPPLAEFLTDIFHELFDCDEKKAVSWRAEFLRLLKPSVSNEEAQQRSTSQRRSQLWTSTAAEAACTALADKFLGDAYLLLQAAGGAEAKKDLLDIFCTASELAYKIFTRKSYIKIYDFNIFASHRFNPKSELMAHHALHNAQLHDDENCLNGKPIVLVSSPAVVVYGKSDGTNYDDRRVWKKAIVFMGRNAPQKPKSGQMQQVQRLGETPVKIKQEPRTESRLTKVKEEQKDVTMWEEERRDDLHIVRESRRGSS
ncbi:hypothetical protein NA57DRAFT_53017 [Rhizodiscina lignyota]|uniref:Uncharacterized protein n=1 Tax=Rhizodiscina lignyota TaxID=1504668 RepID=A0A9P4ILU1_9PEZI|nr:hypothetical protein NA57DRAFT_53017 [Rhizodiscina lignyota]